MEKRFYLGLVILLVLLAGLASVAYGAALIYRPAGFIVGGILLQSFFDRKSA